METLASAAPEAFPGCRAPGFPGSPGSPALEGFVAETGSAGVDQAGVGRAAAGMD